MGFCGSNMVTFDSFFEVIWRSLIATVSTYHVTKNAGHREKKSVIWDSRVLVEHISGMTSCSRSFCTCV